MAIWSQGIATLAHLVLFRAQNIMLILSPLEGRAAVAEAGLDEPARQEERERDEPRDLRRERAERGAEGEQAGHHGHAEADQSRRAQGERLKRSGEFEEGKWYRSASASGGWAATFTVIAPSCVTRIGWSVYNPFSHAGSRGVERSGETYVGDDADDGADEDREEMPCLGGDTRGRGDAPDDQAREHGVSQGLELGALPLGRRGSLGGEEEGSSDRRNSERQSFCVSPYETLYTSVFFTRRLASW